MKQVNALVLLSGGQDSVTCLFWALKHCAQVHTVSFEYGQRHVTELDAIHDVRKVAHAHYPGKLGEHFTLPIPALSMLGDSALTNASIKLEAADPTRGGLPTSFVPGRNTLFLATAAALAVKLDAGTLITGVCHTDYSGYPDCRERFISALNYALNLSLEGIGVLQIVTPVMELTKAEEVALAQSLPGCMEALAFSVTCYNGKRPGCGTCPSCLLRAKGFKDAGVLDPAEQWPSTPGVY